MPSSSKGYYRPRGPHGQPGQHQASGLPGDGRKDRVQSSKPRDPEPELFKLVNVEDHNQIVSVKKKLEVNGSFGEIYQGKYLVIGNEQFIRPGYVAAKKNRASTTRLSEEARRAEQSKLRRRIVKEARVAEYLDHPAITHYFGLFVKDGDQTNELADFYLVSDYVNGGLAREYLSRHRTPANTEKLFSDLMKGLTYMHSEQRIGNLSKKMICHGDLKGNNYLVEIERPWGVWGVPRISGKITDFGLSHILHSTIAGVESANSLASEAIRWRAPEMADIEEGSNMRDLALEKADVWSFSLTALEVVQNEIPFSQSIVGVQAFWKTWLRKPEMLADALPKSNPDEKNLSQAAFEVMGLCWNLDPAKRPTMREVEDRYSALYSEEQLQKGKALVEEVFSSVGDLSIQSLETHNPS